MDLLKEWLNSQKNKGFEQRAEQIRSDYRIKERNGVLWILHGSDAIEEITANAKAEEISRKLEKYREASLKYAGLWKSE